MKPLSFLAAVLLINSLCLGLLVWLRTRQRRHQAERQAFVASWRPVMMQWSLGHPAPLPGNRVFSRQERCWMLQLWNDLRQSLQGESAAYLNGLLQELELRQALLPLLDSRRSGEKIAAIQALGHLHEAEAWKPLVRLALTGDSMLAFQALRALLMISAEAALPVLLEVLRKHRDWSRSRLLGTLRRHPSPRLVAPLGEALLSALQERDFELARDLALLLGALRYPAILPYLRELLVQQPSVRLVDIAAEILGEMRDASALPVLAQLTRHDDIGVRRQAIRAIGKMAGPEQIPALLDALSDPDWWVVYAAIEALHQIPGIRPEKLAELYARPHAQVRDAMQYYQESANLNELPH